MASQYEKRGEVVEFEAGDYCTIKIPKKDRHSGAATLRVLARALRRCGHTYELQTKHWILPARYGVQNLNRIDHCMYSWTGWDRAREQRAQDHTQARR